MTTAKIRGLATAGLLLVSMQICLGEQRQETFKVWWPLFGQKAEQEISALPKAGRAALQKALIACSLFADDYFNVRYQMECERISKAFVVEFSDDASTLAYLFRGAITLTRVQHTQDELDAQQGRRGQDPDPQTRKVFTDILQKAYHDANLTPSNVVAPSPEVASNVPSTPAAPIRIPLKEKDGTYVVSVIINKSIILDFIVDTGASDVSIPVDVVATLVRTGTLQNSDFMGTQTYKLADGSTVPSATFRIRSLSVGKITIENVEASVAPVDGDLLLGQSFLTRFKSWSIDNAEHSLMLGPSPARDVPLMASPAQPSGTEPVGQPSSTPPHAQPTPPRQVIAWTAVDLSLRRSPDPHADTVLPPPYDAIPQGSQITVLDDCKIWTASGRGVQDADNVWCPTIYGNNRGWANAYLMTANDGRRLACIKYPNANGCPR
jgi:clan AA aspartic protease (TIGR02281 family)